MRKRRGSAIVEAALLMPWIVFLFVGTLDVGFYNYASICTQNAARAVAISQATSSTASICSVAIGELGALPNILPTYGGCSSPSYPSSVSGTSPMSVCVTTLSSGGAADANCSSQTSCADCTQDPSATSVQATVAYQTVPLVPIPGILPGKLTFTRTAEVRVLQ